GPFTGPISYLLKFYLKNYVNDTLRANDTAYFRQNFQNYYAYDDGTAEGGYYASFFGGQIALKYKLNFADTLRAIDIFFDPVYGVNLIQNENIRLIIWDDNGGLPHDSIFIDKNLAWPHPCYSTSGYDVFMRYQLSKPVILDSGKIFYIGVNQTTNVQLGIGYDLNSDSHQNVFYLNTNTGSWVTSSIRGSLMMHPVFGDSAQAVGIKQNTPGNESSATIYPNPASNEITVTSADKINKVTITDLLGNILLEEQGPAQKINVSALPCGMYLVRTFSNKAISSTQKLIISR
ncbi:MAG TPA: T9SS type A sorting domain-containing protein, partial [Bacteroidia bacterium]|nr:T9SS type A sorting domain-containing protein [Bacteroidia bacterium]